MREQRSCPICLKEFTSVWNTYYCSVRCSNQHRANLRKLKRTECPNCSREIDPSNFKRHVEACSKRKNGKIKIEEEWEQKNGLYKCPFCLEEYKQKGIQAHIWREHTEEGRAFNSRKGYVQGSKSAWNKGKSYVELFGETKALDYAAKLSSANRANPKITGKGSTPELERKRRRKISKAVKGKTGGYHKGSGRGKQGRYKGYWCDSSWELAFVIYLLDHDFSFERNWQKFPYIYKGETKRWIPRF